MLDPGLFMGGQDQQVDILLFDDGGYLAGRLPFTHKRLYSMRPFRSPSVITLSRSFTEESRLS